MPHLISYSLNTPIVARRRDKSAYVFPVTFQQGQTWKGSVDLNYRLAVGSSTIGRCKLTISYATWWHANDEAHYSFNTGNNRSRWLRNNATYFCALFVSERDKTKSRHIKVSCMWLMHLAGLSNILGPITHAYLIYEYNTSAIKRSRLNYGLQQGCTDKV